MISVRRAGSRYVTEQAGITTWHCFSSGAHYDPDNVAFGSVVAVDEHLVAPDRGFAAHRHRGVELVSWVIDGALQHLDANRTSSVEPGMVQYQDAGSGIEHVEWNASAERPLRFVQIWLSAPAGRPRYALGPAPVALVGGSLAVHRHGPASFPGPTHLYVARGAFAIADDVLGEGDSVRADEPVTVSGDGELLVLTL